MGPPITLFLTTIASEVNLRRRQDHRNIFWESVEYLLRIFQVKKIPFQAYDMASDEQARRLWKRKVPPAKQQLPGFLIDNTFVGTVEEFEAVVEQGDAQLRKFLRLDQVYNADVERLYNTPAPEVVPIGVPGAQMPSEITGHKTVFHGDKNKPVDKSKIVKHDNKLAEGEIDLTEALGGFGLEGVTVTEDELLELIASLGLEDNQADELARGIAGAGAASAVTTSKQPTASEKQPIPTIQTTTPASPPRKLNPEATQPPTITTNTPAQSTSTKPPSRIPVPPSPIVTITPSAPANATESEQITSSPGALTPIAENASVVPTGIMASHEIMSELAKRVGDYNAKRRRTDIKLRRLSSLSNISGSNPNSPLLGPNSPLLSPVTGSNPPSTDFPTSPSTAPSALPTPTRQRKSSTSPSASGSQTPTRQRKSSMFGSTPKPTLPPTLPPTNPLLSPGGNGATSPLDVKGSRIPRSSSSSSLSPSTPPVVPGIKTPSRSRKASTHGGVKVAFPVTEGGGDGPPTEIPNIKSTGGSTAA
ncbi:hypothetical protein FRB98_002870 [Tulasnella sp. 332]|nr:hypothetical protein FRB98_002870 [Tulasnella sp. 332]